MADNPKAAWPKTPDGTTDWEYVFEDSSAGFIPLVAQAQSVEALKMMSTVILEKLFTRKNDADELALHIARLNTIIAAGGGFEGMLRQVNVLMREVKDERIEKARVYIERKKSGAAIDRRAGLLWKIDNLLKPMVLIPVGAVFVLVLSGLVYLLLQSTLGPEPTPAEKAAAEAQQAAEDKAEAEAEAAQDALDEAEPEPLPVLFKSLRWPLTTKYTTDRPQYYSVVLYVKGWDHKTEVCRRLPTVMDRFYTSFSDTMPLNRQPREAELQAVGVDIKDAINAILPGSYVTDVLVGRYGTREFRITARPPYCYTPPVPAPKKAE